MEISDYEQYYQKGGTYVLPIEMFNELWGEMKNWKDTCKQKESIIKEVREYITTEQLYTDYQWSKSQYEKILKDLLEILDKENKDV